MKGRSPAARIQSLPRWARVAFAARCARLALPLFVRSRPGAEPRRFEPLGRAVDLAERSAAEGRGAEGLREARVDALVTAGAAIMPALGESLTGGEVGPAGEDACHIASFAARSAERAATAAMSDRKGAETAALEAFAFARDAAELAGADDLAARIRDDLDGLRRVAGRGRWRDDTVVPPRVFELLPDPPRRGAWRRLWW